MLDERLTSQAGIAEADRARLGKSLGTAVFWLVFLLFLPALVGALGLEGLLAPVQNTLNQILSVVPNLLGAGLILLAGWFIARIVRQIVISLLAAAGADALGERVGLQTALGKQTLSGLLGAVAYALILIPAIIAALNALQVEAISRPTVEMLTTCLPPSRRRNCSASASWPTWRRVSSASAARWCWPS